jgi:hypothetical protein
LKDFPHTKGGSFLRMAITAINGDDVINRHSKSNGVRPFHRPPLNLYPSPEDTQSYVCSLAEVIDYNATHNPDHVFCVQAERKTETTNTQVTEEYGTDNRGEDCNFPPLLRITNAELRNAIARCGEWLRQTIPEVQLPIVQDDGTVKKGNPIALFMESDIGLLLHQLALVGLGVPVSIALASTRPLAILPSVLMLRYSNKLQQLTKYYQRCYYFRPD